MLTRTACMLEAAAGIAICVLLLLRGYGNAAMLWLGLIWFDAGLRLIKARNG